MLVLSRALCAGANAGLDEVSWCGVEELGFGPWSGAEVGFRV